MRFRRKPSPSPSHATREALAEAQAKARQLEERAETARWESLSPAQQADELSRKASRARLDAEVLEGEVEAAEEEAETAAGGAPRDTDDEAEGEAADHPERDEPAPASLSAGAAAARPGMPQLPPMPPDPSRAEFEAAQQRITEMEAIATFAKRHGVGFDLPTAIRSRLTVQAARDQVMNARADADEALVTHSHFPHASQAAANAAQGWNRATARAAERYGHKMPESGR